MSCEGCGANTGTRRRAGLELCDPCAQALREACNTSAPVASPALGNHRVRVDLAGLRAVEAVLVRTLVAVLADPMMSPTRERMFRGEVTLAIEADEVTFIETEAVADELAARLAAVALPGGAS